MASSQKQIQANRENAKKSTGPRSAEGKKRSAQNSQKHGLTSAKIGLDFIDDKRELANHRNAVLAFYHPQNALELHWVDHIVVAQWRMNQLVRWESGMFNQAIKENWQANTDQEDEDSETLNVYVKNIVPAEKISMQNGFIADGMARLMRKRDYVKTFLRYQAQAVRLIRHAEEELAKIRNEAKISAATRTNQTTALKTNEPNSAPGPSHTAWQPTTMSQ